MCTLELVEKFVVVVVVGGWWLNVNLVFKSFSFKLKFWTWTKPINNFIGKILLLISLGNISV